MLPLYIALIGCAAKNVSPDPGYLQPGGNVVGTVNGEPVTQAVIDAELSQLPPDFRMQLEVTGQYAEMEQQVLLKEALYQEALREDVLKDEQLQVQVAIAARDAMIEALLIEIADERTTDEALQAWYDENIEQFQARQASAAHILVEEQADAAAIMVELEGGADFAAIARERSIDPSAPMNGGDLGWFGEQQMVPPFAAAVFTADAESVVGPVETQFGWHVIRVDAFRDAIPLEDVRDEIVGIVQEDIVGDYVEEIRARAIGPAPGAEPEPEPEADAE